MSKKPPPFSLVLTLACALLFVSAVASLALGAMSISFAEVLAVLREKSDSNASLAVWDLRMPRGLAAATAGAALAVSGCILQTVLRNPLGDSGVMGVEAGAALALMVSLVAFPALSAFSVPLAFLGGALAAAMALSFAGGARLTPLRLALSGVAVGATCSAVARGLQILFPQSAQMSLLALSGSLAGRSWQQVAAVGPWIALGLVLAVAVAGRLNLLALSENVAQSLGVNTRRDGMLLTLLAVLLAAAAVALTGPIGHIGLMVPHVARALVGHDHRFSVPICALLGASLLLLADVGARLFDAPAETPVALLIAAIGAPFFVLLARRLKA